MFVDGLTSSHLAYRLVKKDQARLQAAFEKLPAPAREIAHYKSAVARIDGVDALLKDRRALTVALAAFQLESEVDKKALIRKILVEDPADSKSLVKRLADPRWESFAKAFHSLSSDGGAALRQGGAVETVIAGYRTNEFEKAMGETNEAVREALYFRRIAPTLATTTQVLGNRVAAKVVREALGLPLAFGALDVKQQVRMLDAKQFDPATFKDPALLEKFIGRFLAASDRAAAAAAPSSEVQLIAAALRRPGVDLLA